MKKSLKLKQKLKQQKKEGSDELEYVVIDTKEVKINANGEVLSGEAAFDTITYSLKD